MQEGVVKRCNEEKVTVESTERWYVNLCAWLCSWKIFLSSRIWDSNHYFLVHYPMCGGHIFIQIKVNPPKKCFHSRHGVIWNRACENINIWTKTQNYADWTFISPINSVLRVTLLSLPKTIPSVMWRPTTFETVASTHGFVSSSVRMCKLMIACSEWASRLASILFKFPPTWFDRY